MTGHIESRIKALGLRLPEVAAPAANYVPWVQQGSVVYVSGQISRTGEGAPLAGKLGAGMNVEQGQTAARSCAIGLIATLKAACGGDLDRVRRTVKLTGFVNSAPEFPDQHKVMNGCSDLIVEILGEAGRHARSAVGVAALPLGAAVEVEGIFEIA
jgi:enamine deaminase RidA (YjgF/YER057c/UK114 family)